MPQIETVECGQLINNLKAEVVCTIQTTTEVVSYLNTSPCEMKMLQKEATIPSRML